ncbi:MAG TPA: hypothetical protein VFB22_05090 [Candidatus Baltobacteraceae bacterium]|nr:hypothetical protein [Candidatus Baltobacteraceae bacterium]
MTREPSSAPSGPYDTALREMQSETPDVVRAFRLLEAARDAGDVRALYALATWFLHGKEPVVEKNLAVAYEMLTAAAQAGSAEALYDLGVMYELGEIDGSPRLRDAALAYLKGAVLGNGEAIYAVSRCYWYGLGVPEDRDVARVWFDRAKELGTAESEGDEEED